jgi:anti-sigma B factor antagonist
MHAMRERFELPGELTIYSAAETREALLAWLRKQDLSSAAPLEVGAAQVEEIDGAGLQLLGALAQTLAKQGVPWHLRDASIPVQEACKTMGSAWLDGAANAIGESA